MAYNNDQIQALNYVFNRLFVDKGIKDNAFPTFYSDLSTGGGSTIVIGSPANGLALDGSGNLTLGAAATGLPGALTALAQNISGIKTFQNDIATNGKLSFTRYLVDLGDNSAPTTTPGAMTFDAHADRLSNNTGSVQLPVNNTSYSVCLWVKPRTPANVNQVLFESDASGTTYSLALVNGILTILDNGGGFVSRVQLGSALTIGKWYFVGMKINGTTGTLYLGDETTPTVNTAGTITAQGAAFRIVFGSDAGVAGYNANADICLARLWNAQLANSEFETERASPTVVRTANLTGNWNFASTANRLVDSGPNNYTLVGFTGGAWNDVTGPTFGMNVPSTSVMSNSTNGNGYLFDTVNTFNTGFIMRWLTAGVPKGQINWDGEYENYSPGKGMYLRAPNGTRYVITVSNAGALVVTAA